MRNSARRSAAANAPSPRGDAEARHPDWTIRLSELHGLQLVVDAQSKLILIDPAGSSGRYALAVAVAHLDLGHITPDGGGAFTEQQEADADGLARLRLDDPDVVPAPRSGRRWLARMAGLALASVFLLWIYR